MQESVYHQDTNRGRKNDIIGDEIPWDKQVALQFCYESIKPQPAFGVKGTSVKLSGSHQFLLAGKGQLTPVEV